MCVSVCGSVWLFLDYISMSNCIALSQLLNIEQYKCTTEHARIVLFYLFYFKVIYNIFIFKELWTSLTSVLEKGKKNSNGLNGKCNGTQLDPVCWMLSDGWEPIGY